MSDKFKIGDIIDYDIYKNVKIVKKGMFYYTIKDKKGNLVVIDMVFIDKHGKLSKKEK